MFFPYSNNHEISLADSTIIFDPLYFQGWIHYMTHEPEPHILLFRRPLTQN
jgi:hypothetical protein